jgi:hypothetical protein
MRWTLKVLSARFFVRTNNIWWRAKSCGPDAAGLASSLQMMVLQATVTKKVMDTGESAKQP